MNETLSFVSLCVLKIYSSWCEGWPIVDPIESEDNLQKVSWMEKGINRWMGGLTDDGLLEK